MLKCGCGERLFVTNTYSPGQKAEVRALQCPKCGTRHTQIAVLVCEAEEAGDGAVAISRRIENGEDPYDVALEKRSD